MAGKALVIVEGNLGADPEMRVTPNGVVTTAFSLANTPRFQKDGEWQDGETTWFRCVAWDKKAEAITETLRKGMTVQVTGRLANRKFTDKEGNERTSLEINVDTVGVIPKVSGGGKRDSGSDDDPWGNDAPF